MPPAMMMSGQGPRPHGPIGGPQHMQGPSMQQGMPRGAPPRPMHQVSASMIYPTSTKLVRSQELLDVHGTLPSHVCMIYEVT